MLRASNHPVPFLIPRTVPISVSVLTFACVASGINRLIFATPLTPLPNQGQLFRISQLIGVDAKSKEGQSLGQIDDVVVNPRTHKINFAVLGKGGFLGLGEKVVPVPWEAVQVKKSPAAGTEEKPELTVNIDQQKMKTAPTLQDKQYSELNKPDYVITIYRFYQIEPVGVGGTGQGAETQSDTQQQQQQQQD